LYAGIGENEDGIVDVEVPAEEPDSAEPAPNYQDWVGLMDADKLTSEELQLIQRYHNGQVDKISFAIVDAEGDTIQRLYKGTTPRLLASVTKLFTAITSLENVRGVEVPKVKAMLKTSDNAAASRYVRLAAKALTGLETEGSPNTGHSSCPSQASLDQEHPAAATVFDWIQKNVPSNSWAGAALKDGAGCDYGNFMSPIQVAQTLRFADRQGKAYAGQNFEQLLSISGVDGTWRSRNRDAKGRVLAKTGTLRAASNLSGYFYAQRGGKMHKYYFSVLVSKSSSQNPTETRTMIEGLVRYWLQYYNQNTGTPIAQL